jgi:hypothetical protein
MKKLKGESKAVGDHPNKSPHITCLTCNKKGCYANKYPERSQSCKRDKKSNEIAELGIFVGTKVIC